MSTRVRVFTSVPYRVRADRRPGVAPAGATATVFPFLFPFPFPFPFLCTTVEEPPA
ncbi:hypothetical protein [Streptomyces sp. NPDC048606]|uniref:hypothetical protein n=1 Tax=Streptomyces sp. NPDC048606 TaxID=3154726 RepID=UPI00343034C3